MHALVFGKARMAARTLVARAGGVFMWPGIALTERRGAACVPIAADVARFWISRLHGPEVDDWAVLRCLAIAAQKLSEGDGAGAQQALDASGPTRLSADGAALMRAVAGSLGIGPLDLPWAEGPRLWRADVIAAHLPLFKDYAPAAGLLAKAGPGTSPNIRAGPRDRKIIKAGGSTMVRAALSPGAAGRRPASAIMPGRRSESRRQKFRRWIQVPKSSAMPLLSLQRGGRGNSDRSISGKSA